MLIVELPEPINIICGLSVLHGEYVNRPSHVLIFKCSGESVYTFSDRTITLTQGEMLFIPEGASYTVRRTGSSESRYVLLNFHAKTAPARPEKFSFHERMDFPHLCTLLSKYRLLDTPADRYRLLSLFYEILAHTCHPREGDYRTDATLQRIDPAVEYLRENLFDTALKIGDLHTLCGMSDTYFRRLFIARFGVSPKQYVCTRRLAQAKAILDNGEYNSIAEAAALAGFEDALYFSRVFKRRYGYPPSALP